MPERLWTFFRAFAFSVFLGILSSGCSTVSYLYQASEGQLKIWSRTTPISKLKENPDLEDSLKQKFDDLDKIKAFSKELGLETDGQYESYLDWDQPYLVYVLTVTPKTSLEPKKWSFPLVGSFPYLGFFDQASALARQKRFRHQDTYVRGTRAYSSLGWFKDPVPSPLLELSRPLWMETIIHELVHATVFIEDDVEFNEQLASYYAREAMLFWLHENNLNQELRKFEEYKESSEVLFGFFQKLASELENIYHNEALHRGEKLRERQEAFRKAQARWKKMGEKYNWSKSFQGIELNNAVVSSFQTYGKDWSLFERLLGELEEGQVGLKQFMLEIKKFEALREKSEKKKSAMDAFKEFLDSR